MKGSFPVVNQMILYYDDNSLKTAKEFSNEKDPHHRLHRRGRHH
jgi:hypothetical protein